MKGGASCAWTPQDAISPRRRVPLEPRDVAEAVAMERVAEWMADAVLASVSERPFPAEVQSLFLTEPLPGLDGVDGVMFSGGVAEYVYEREMREFGDMGPLLAARCEERWMRGPCPGPCCRPASVSAPRRSGPPSTACS